MMLLENEGGVAGFRGLTLRFFTVLLVAYAMALFVVVSVVAVYEYHTKISDLEVSLEPFHDQVSTTIVKHAQSGTALLAEHLKALLKTEPRVDALQVRVDDKIFLQLSQAKQGFFSRSQEFSLVFPASASVSDSYRLGEVSSILSGGSVVETIVQSTVVFFLQLIGLTFFLGAIAAVIAHRLYSHQLQRLAVMVRGAISKPNLFPVRVQRKKILKGKDEIDTLTKLVNRIGYEWCDFNEQVELANYSAKLQHSAMDLCSNALMTFELEKNYFKMLYANKAFTALTGYKSSEMSADVFLDLCGQIGPFQNKYHHLCDVICRFDKPIIIGVVVDKGRYIVCEMTVVKIVENNTVVGFVAEMEPISRAKTNAPQIIARILNSAA